MRFPARNKFQLGPNLWLLLHWLQPLHAMGSTSGPNWTNRRIVDQNRSVWVRLKINVSSCCCPPLQDTFTRSQLENTIQLRLSNLVQQWPANQRGVGAVLRGVGSSFLYVRGRCNQLLFLHTWYGRDSSFKLDSLMPLSNLDIVAIPSTKSERNLTTKTEQLWSDLLGKRPRRWRQRPCAWCVCGLIRYTGLTYLQYTYMIDNDNGKQQMQ